MVIELNDNLINNISSEKIKNLEQQHEKLEVYATHGYIYNIGAQFFNILKILWNVPFGSIKLKELKNITFIWTKKRITQLIEKEVSVLEKHQNEKIGDKNFQTIAKIIDHTAHRCLNEGKYKGLEATCAKIVSIRKVLEKNNSTCSTPDTQKIDFQRDITQGAPATSLISTTTTTGQQALDHLKEDVLKDVHQNIIYDQPTVSSTVSEPRETGQEQTVKNETRQEKPVESEHPEKPKEKTFKTIKARVIKMAEGFRWSGLLKAALVFGLLFLTVSYIKQGNSPTVQPQSATGLPEDLSSHNFKVLPENIVKLPQDQNSPSPGPSEPIVNVQTPISPLPSVVVPPTTPPVIEGEPVLNNGPAQFQSGTSNYVRTAGYISSFVGLVGIGALIWKRKKPAIDLIWSSTVVSLPISPGHKSQVVEKEDDHKLILKKPKIQLTESLKPKIVAEMPLSDSEAALVKKSIQEIDDHTALNALTYFSKYSKDTNKIHAFTWGYLANRFYREDKIYKEGSNNFYAIVCCFMASDDRFSIDTEENIKEARLKLEATMLESDVSTLASYFDQADDEYQVKIKLFKKWIKNIMLRKTDELGKEKEKDNPS